MANLTESLLRDISHVRDMSSTASGDLTRIEGVPNLTNALYHRLITTPGSLIHKPGYGVGLKDFQNTINQLSRQRQLAARIEAQFKLDPRVDQVLGVLVNYDELNPSQTTIRVRVKALGLEDIPMTFTPFSKA